jgi:hypothetical protein
LEERLAECRRGEVGPVTRIFWNLNYEAIVRNAIGISSKNDFVLDVGCGSKEISKEVGVVTVDVYERHRPDVVASHHYNYVWKVNIRGILLSVS